MGVDPREKPRLQTLLEFDLKRMEETRILFFTESFRISLLAVTIPRFTVILRARVIHAYTHTYTYVPENGEPKARRPS